MAKFKDKEREEPGISTASLPDIVFMLIIFFMVSTQPREENVLVEQKLPKATQLQKIEKTTPVSYLYIGKPRESSFGDAPKIQANDVFIDDSEIILFVEKERSKIEQYKQNQLTISLKGDSDAQMGLVSDIKQELRKADARVINYAAIQKGTEE